MATILEEFLVKLSYSIDLAQHRRFEDNLKSSNVLIEKFAKGLTDSLAKFSDLATAATGSALTIAAAMAKISDAMAGTSYAADRIGVSVGSIRAMDTAFRSVGGSAGQAQSMMERLAAHMARQPGFLLQFPGVDPNARPDQALLQIGDYFRKLMAQGEVGHALMLQQADKLGYSYSEAVMLANQRMRPTFQQAQRDRGAWGIDDQTIHDQSERANRLLVDLRSQFQDFEDWLYTTWGKRFNDALENGLTWFKANLPTIKADLQATEQAISNFVDTVERWWNALSPSGQHEVESVFAVAVLLRITRLPLVGVVGQIGLLAAAIGTLITGYEHWKETGQSTGFIDWSKWGPALDTAITTLNHLNNDIIAPLAAKLGVKETFLPAFEALALYLAGPALLKAALGGGLGGLLRLLAFVPGSGITRAMLGALGVAGVAEVAGVVAGAEIGKMGIATPEKEKEGKDAPKLDHEMMSAEDASRRIQEDWAGIDEQPQGFFGRALQGARGFLGLGGSGKLDPGQAHSANEIATYFQSMGWSKEQSEGIAANAIAESSGQPRRANASDHVGLFQWDRARQQTFARRYGYTMTDPSISEERLFRDELDFANWELRNTESIAGKKLAEETTPEGAAVSFGQNYERYGPAGSPEDLHRAGIARQLAAGGAGAAPPAPATGPATAGATPSPPAPPPAGGAAAAGAKGAGLGLVPSADAAEPTTPVPVGNLGLVRNPDGTIGTPGGGGLGLAPGLTAPTDLAPAQMPAAPPPATINNNSTSGDTNHISQNFAPNITVNGVQDPQRTAQLIDRNINRQWTEYGVHAGSAYA